MGDDIEFQRFLAHGTMYSNIAINFGYPVTKWRDGDPIPEDFKPTVGYKSLDALAPEIAGRPVVVVGSGPSLDKNAYLLKGAPADWRIISCDGSIHTLSKLGIRPHFVITCELEGRHARRATCMSTDLILRGMDEAFYRDVPLICTAWASCSFLDLWPCKERYFYMDGDLRHAEPADKFGHVLPPGLPVLRPRATVVGFHGIEVARHLMASEVILLGCDMQATRMKHHAEDFNISWENTNTDLQDVYERHLDWFMRHFKGRFDFNVTNCTEGGALTAQRTDCRVMTLHERIKKG